MNSTTTHPVQHQPGQTVLSPYHYVPTEWVCILFMALFGISAAIHLIEAIYFGLWSMIPTATLANIAEVIGWSARLWSSLNPPLLNPFIIQISTTIIAPTPLVAANFIILGQLIRRLGQQYSRLNATWYTIIFCSCDLVALVVQALGGAMASTAVNTGKNPNDGGHVMLGGIIFQMVAITIYVALASEFVLRYLYSLPIRTVPKAEAYDEQPLDKKTKLMLIGLTFSSVTIFIRSVYRTIELTDGWDGKIISTQVLFNVLDGGMITLATFSMNILHPGILLGHAHTWKK